MNASNLRKCGVMMDFSALRRQLRVVFIRSPSVFVLAAMGVLLSVASGFTTWAGITKFTGFGLVWLSLFITLGLQVIMLVASWLIATEIWKGNGEGGFVKDIRRNLGRWAKIALLLVVFLVPFVVSVGFSAVSLFSKTLFSDEQRTIAARDFARGEVGVSMTETKRLLEPARVKAHEEWYATQELAEFQERVRVVLATYNANEASLKSYYEAISADRNAELAELRQKRAQLIATRNVAEARTQLPAPQDAADTGNSQLADLNDALNEAQQKVEEQRSLQRGATTEADREANGTGETGQSGCGPKCRAFREQARQYGTDAAIFQREADAIKARIDAIQGLAQQAEESRTGAAATIANSDTEIESLDERINALVLEASAADAGSSQRTNIEYAFTALQQPGSLASQSGADYLLDDAGYQALGDGNASAAEIAANEANALEAIGLMCGELVQLVERINPSAGGPVSPEALTRIKETVNDANCDATSVINAAAEARALDTGFAVFEGEIGQLNTGGSRAEPENCVTGLGNHARSSNDLLNFAQGCLESSGLPSGAIREQFEVLSLLRIEHPFGENAEGETVEPQEFVRVKAALIDYGIDSAWLALLIAIAIDALVFISAVVGAGAMLRPLDELGGTDAEKIRPLVGLNLEIYEEDSVAIRGRKEFLAHVTSRAVSDEKDPYTQAISLSDVSNVSARARLRSILSAGSTQLGNQLLVKPVAGDGERTETFHIHRKFFEDLAKDVVDWERAYQSVERMPIAPSPREATASVSDEPEAVVSLKDWLQQARPQRSA